MEWRAYPLDVVFFRGTEPMNAGESGVVRGLFPPSPEVLQGFVRSLLLEALGVGFETYARLVRSMGARFPEEGDPAAEAVRLLGRPGDDLGKLEIRGPYLVWERDGAAQRWYPAPLDLVKDANVWYAVSPGGAVESDLGSVRFLAKPGQSAGLWISERGLQSYLDGRAVDADDLTRSETFYSEERRTGIARNPVTHVSRDQMLYSPAFIRLKDSRRDQRLAIGFRVEGIPDDLQRRCAGVHRLGGEGRLAEVEVHPDPPLPPAPRSGRGYRLLLLTPAFWGGWWLPTRTSLEADGWPAEFDGLSVTVVAAVVGKPVMIGGWNMVDHRPKSAVPCVPAGSVYFVRARDAANLPSLYDRKLGGRTAAGFGQVVVGRWE